MSISFNKDFNYDNYKFVISQKEQQEAQKLEKKEEIPQSDAKFIGLENDMDLLTQGMQASLGINFSKTNTEDANLVNSTNDILASLGYNYKVSNAQVASVQQTMKNIVEPDLKLIENGAVAQNIQDPDGPFADLFI